MKDVGVYLFWFSVIFGFALIGTNTGAYFGIPLLIFAGLYVLFAFLESRK